jgi:hypothetical protein
MRLPIPCHLSCPVFCNAQPTSRPIPFRQREGILNDHDFAVIRGDDDFHDVKAVADVGEVQHPEPGDGAAGDEVLFFAVNGLRGITEFAGLAGFYLGEDEFIRVEVAADEVNFATARSAEISVKDFEARAFEVLCREVFALPAQSMRSVFSRGGVEG